MMNKKQVLELLNGKKVLRQYINTDTVDDIDRIRKELQESILANGDDLSILEEDEKTFSFKGYQNFIFKPRCKNGIGLFQVKSKDYTFLLDGTDQKSYGSIPKVDDMQILENGFINILGYQENGEIHGIKYTIVE